MGASQLAAGAACCTLGQPSPSRPLDKWGTQLTEWILRHRPAYHGYRHPLRHHLHQYPHDCRHLRWYRQHLRRYLHHLPSRPMLPLQLGLLVRSDGITSVDEIAPIIGGAAGGAVVLMLALAFAYRRSIQRTSTAKSLVSVVPPSTSSGDLGARYSVTVDGNGTSSTIRGQGPAARADADADEDMVGVVRD